MFLVSIDIEYRYNIINKIKKSNKNIKTSIFTIDNINYYNYKKYDYVITQYNPKLIDYFLKLGKKIVICSFDEELIKEEYRNNSKIFICNTKKEVIDFVLTEYTANNYQNNKVYKCLKAFIYLAIFLVFAFFLYKRLYVCKGAPTSKKVSNEIDLKKENYVFLGDSITDYYNLDKYYGDLPVVNSGISGNEYHDLLDNLDQRVFKYNPTKVFILIGTNDIAYTDVSNEELTDKIIEICDKIQEERSKTEIYVESIYPVNKNMDNNGMVSKRTNSRIRKVNKLLEEKVKENNYKYIDMYDILKDAEGNLNPRYTYDGLHISEDGYKEITKEIKKIIYNGSEGKEC